MADETSTTDAGTEQTPDAAADTSTPKPFAELTDGEKVEFLLAKTRRLEDAQKGKSADPDARALRARVKELEKYEATVRDLEEASRTEAEKAVRKAQADGERAGREAALAEARKTYGSQLVAVRLEAAADAKGMTAEQMLVAAGDLSRFLGDEGVDGDALTQFLGALPDKPATAVPSPLTPGAFGGGRREAAPAKSGADLYHELHPQRTAAST
jgi:hypothetical protein